MVFTVAVLSCTSSVSPETSVRAFLCYAIQREALKLSRKNDDMRPFELGGETHLEHLARKADCGMFVLDSHSKKRPHNLILGR